MMQEDPPSVPAYDRYSLPAGATASLCFDVLRKAGLAPRAIGSPLEPLIPCVPFIGRAFTVRGEADPRIGDHESLLQWTRMLSLTPANAVLVIAPGDCERAYMGELSANALVLRHSLAAVVDGPCRDTTQIRALGYPVFCRGVTPRDVVGAWHPVEFGGSITVNGCEMSCADLVIGDADGLCIAPVESYHILCRYLKSALNSENLVRAAILGGSDPLSAYQRHGKF